MAPLAKSFFEAESQVFHLRPENILTMPSQKTISFVSRTGAEVVQFNRFMRTRGNRMPLEIRASGRFQIVQSGVRKRRKDMAIKNQESPKGRKPKTKIKQ